MIQRRRRGGRKNRFLRRQSIEMSRRGLEAIVAALHESIMPDIIGHNHCVLSARLLVDVLRSVNVNCVALPCILAARNAICASLRDSEEGRALTAEQRKAAGAHEVVIAEAFGDQLAPRHLVVGVKLDQWYLVDASITQIARPDREIPDANAIIEPIPADGIIERGGVACFEAPCGAQFEYTLLPGYDTWYRESEDWTWEKWSPDTHAAYLNMILRVAAETLQRGHSIPEATPN